MSVIIIGNEKNFTALRPRLFTGSVSSKVAGSVSAAIEVANPGVDLRKLVPGTVLDIPDGLPEVSVDQGVALDPASHHAIVAVLEASSATIAALVAAATAQQGADAAARKPVLAALDGSAVAALAKTDASLGPRVAAARKSLAAADAADKGSQAALTQARGQWQKELSALEGLANFG